MNMQLYIYSLNTDDSYDNNDENNTHYIYINEIV